MIIRVIFVCSLAVLISSCDAFRPDRCGTFSDSKTDDGTASSTPFAPSTIYCADVQIITQSQSDDDEINSTNDNEDDDTDDNDDKVITITSSHVNDNGVTIYKIGPGSSFTLISGSANIVWCKISSNCNGDNRTVTNVTNPPSTWISYKHAEFRRSGSDGSSVIFNVDGQMIKHSF